MSNFQKGLIFMEIKPLKRLWSTLVAVLLTGCLAIPAVHAAGAAAVPSDIQDHWCRSAAYSLLQRGIVYTHPDGLYHPDEYITKADAVCFLYNLIQARAAETHTLVNPLPAGTVVHPQLQGGWATPILESMTAANILLGDLSGNFYLYSPLSRGELAAMLYRAEAFHYLSLPVPTVNVPASLPGVDGQANQMEVRDMCARGIFDLPSGSLDSSAPVTWAELSLYFLRAGQYSPLEPLATVPSYSVPNPSADSLTPAVSASYNVITVPYSSQCYPYGAWVGCEPTCLYMALQYRGAAQGVTLKSFLDNLPRDASNPARGFVGSPYVVDKSKRTTIYPAKLAEYGRNYYQNVYDFSGATPANLQAEVLAGNPVVAYVTLWWNKPVYTSYNIDGETQQLISNNHAVLVTGYNAATGQYHITDPYNLKAADRNAPYTYWVDAATFDALYNVRQHALVIR